LLQHAAQQREDTETMREQLMVEFQKKEARLLQATSEDHQQEIRQIQQDAESKIHALEEQMAKERKASLIQQEKYRRLLEEAEGRAETAETQSQHTLKKQENDLAQAQMREHRALRITEEKLAQTMAILDERDDEVIHLKAVLKNLESAMNEHQEGVEEAEEEADLLNTENEAFQKQIDDLEVECEELRSQVGALEADSERLGSIQVRGYVLLRQYNFSEILELQTQSRSRLCKDGVDDVERRTRPRESQKPVGGPVCGFVSFAGRIGTWCSSIRNPRLETTACRCFSRLGDCSGR
jgi:chromosome segregation ATPase